MKYRTLRWCIALGVFFTAALGVSGEALFVERFDYENGELSEASSNRWLPTSSDTSNPNLFVVDNQLKWDFTGTIADPVNNGYYGAIFDNSGISSGVLYSYFDLEVLQAPIGGENTAGIFFTMWNGGGGNRSRTFIAAVPDGDGGIVGNRFRLGITKQSGSRFDAIYYPEDWEAGTKLTVLIKSDFDAETVSLYINPETEEDAHALADDGTFLGIKGIAVRHRDESEDGVNIGIFRVDNIAITRTFGDFEAPPDLPPSGLTVSGVPGAGVSVNWEDNSDGETGFRIERREVGGTEFSDLGSVSANRTHFLDSTGTLSTPYEYRVVALLGDELLSEVSASTEAYSDPLPLISPLVEAVRQENNLQLNFTGQGNATYEVQESTDLSTWKALEHLQLSDQSELSVLVEPDESGRNFARVVSSRFSLPPVLVGLSESFQMPVNGSGAVVNLSDFGVTASNSDDNDSLGLQAAIDSLETGDILRFQEGVYHLKSSINVPSGITLEAIEGEAVEFVTIGIESGFRLSPSVSDVTLRGFAVIGDDTVLRYGVELGESNISGPERIWLKGLRIEGFARQGIRMRSTKHVKVENCHILNATDLGGGGRGYAVELHGNSCEQNWIVGNVIGPVIRHGVLLQFSAHNNLVEKNTCFETTEDAYDLHGEDEYANELRFNLAYWDGDSAPLGSPSGFGVGNTGATHDRSGPGNWIHHNEVVGYQLGIEVIQQSHIVFIDANKLHDNPVAGIKLHNGSGNSVWIRGNAISGSEVGVDAQPGSAGLVVDGNLIYDNAIGVQTSGDLLDYRIINNDLRGNETAAILGDESGDYLDNQE
jgi:hypothetical protein